MEVLRNTTVSLYFLFRKFINIIKLYFWYFNLKYPNPKFIVYFFYLFTRLLLLINYEYFTLDNFTLDNNLTLYMAQPKYPNDILHPSNSTDTDTLKDYLQIQKDGTIYKEFVGDTAIKFSKYYTGQGENNKGLSRIARFVHKNYPNIFYEKSLNNTKLNDELLAKLSNLKRNVPSNFR